MSFSRIAIIGPGLLGGSVAMAVREHLAGGTVSLWARRQAAVEDLRQRNIADLASSDLSEVTRGANLIILATPVGAMADLLAQILESGALADNAVITDVGSVKEAVVNQMDAQLAEQPNIQFVGSHPMAGSEQTGVEFARSDLFQNAACIITAGKTSRDDSPQRISEFWRDLGCRVMEMDAAAHDSAVAKISHLPHLIASALVNSALSDDPSVASLSAGGFRDTTRVASGSPAMWAEIALENRAALREPLERMAGEIRDLLAFLDGLKHEELLHFLERAKKLRDAL